MSQNLLTFQEACDWASKYLEKDVGVSNISYLVQYGKVKKYEKNGFPQVDVKDLKNYYKSINGLREFVWKNKLGKDLNWVLSFDDLREKDTTKHVHRLHPYKGKFIPQLVEYFIDDHIDDFKNNVFFRKGDIVLDPFLGSGTTSIQASELGIHSVGIDVSRFNCMIAEVKLEDYDIASLEKDIKKVLKAFSNSSKNKMVVQFENKLKDKIREFNDKYFPTPSYKRKLHKKEIKEEKYGKQKEGEFLNTYNQLINEYQIELKQEKKKSFLDKWYVKNVRKEIEFVFNEIKKIENEKNKKALALILSRTIRSCRATTHSDLATLKQPQLTTYYCWKHKKICKPLFSIRYWFVRYVNDTLKRIKKFNRLKKDAESLIITADSRNIDISEEIKKKNKKLFDIFSKKKIKGIFTSPPYVGQIDYHEQHAYAYDLFGFDRKDDLEIGPLYKGKGVDARKFYVRGIVEVLNNCKKYLANDCDIFIVANDKHNLYPDIANKSGMKIVNQYKRPVLNRTERDRTPYSETIFHLKSKKE